ncbi:hypothetical protein [Lihuaxuella thermophila]|uniref:Uncharacterized protein n=1 Tax=Lihuaxuella thermophila TaxID=1173111 RepID=A0A1H8JB39_9BACL|nr:hypothetical protein [Lihuaxuella thermophila]SEN77879.1 hypothetical protein SAMN05444955_12320 [Lihuaxuella thermophila]
MKAQIMKRAHQLAKQMIGDYAARLALALRLAWKEAKEMEDQIVTITVNRDFARKNGLIARNQFTGKVVRETEKAILIYGNPGPKFRGVLAAEKWIPKSVIE